MGIEFHASTYDCFSVDTNNGQLPNNILTDLSKNGIYLSVGCVELRKYRPCFLYYYMEGVARPVTRTLEEVVRMIEKKGIKCHIVKNMALICGDLELED